MSVEPPTLQFKRLVWHAALLPIPPVLGPFLPWFPISHSWFSCNSVQTKIPGPITKQFGVSLLLVQRGKHWGCSNLISRCEPSWEKPSYASGEKAAREESRRFIRYAMKYMRLRIRNMLDIYGEESRRFIKYAMKYICLRIRYMFDI